MAQGQQVPPSRIGWDVLCYDCKQGWRPGHTCIRQPTAQERQALLDQAEWLRIMDDVLEHFGHKTALAAPEVWEAI
jgi:hypothetical protein